jgi:hypothetical protein
VPLQDAKFASTIAEMKEMHESELDQVRAHCERRLHDEVEQAKHDISRSLEEQIQVLLLSLPLSFGVGHCVVT